MVMQANGYDCNEVSVSAQHMNDTKLQKPMQMHSGSLPRQTQIDGGITGYFIMLCYKLAGALAGGGVKRANFCTFIYSRLAQTVFPGD